MRQEVKIKRIKKIAIKWIDIISVVIFLLCMDVRYINNHSIIPSTLLFAIRIVLVGLFSGLILVYGGKRKKRHAYGYWVLVLFVLSLTVRTVLYGTGIYTFWLQFSRPLLLCAFYQFFCIMDVRRGAEVRYRILSTWRNLLLLLVVLDLLTMILYPSGMYATALYTENWFLGYKTERLVYSLPLAVFDSFLAFKRRGKSNVGNYLVIALCIVTSLYSDGTASLAALVVFLCLVIVLNFAKKLKAAKKLMNRFLTYQVIIPVYAFVVWLVVWVQNSAVVLYIVQNILGKDPTLTTRTSIWLNCLKALSKHPLFGYGYQDSSFFIRLTSNVYATSPHSFSLSLLLYGGIVGCGIYILFMAVSLRQGKKQRSNASLIFVFGILALLLNGITSSTMVFSVFGFIYYIMLENETIAEQYRLKI